MSLKLLIQQFFQVAIPLISVTRCFGYLLQIIAITNDMNFTFRPGLLRSWRYPSQP